MAKTAQDYSNQIRAQLKVLDPTLSADPLTPERKIIDTVSEVLASSSIDSFTLNYQYDVDTKVGTDLDKFVALFGFARQAGRRATGVATFSRAVPPSSDILIDAGTQIVKPATSVTSVVIFYTTASVVLPTGGSSVDAPIEAADVGPLYNVPADTINTISGTASDASAVTNSAATTGGVDQETDAELRVRFKNTIFRNIAGTSDQYLALAISSRFANKANIIGPISRFNEFVQVPATGTIISQIPYSKYTYSYDYYLTNGDATTEVFYTPRGADYTFTTTVPPTIAINASATTTTSSVTLPLATIPVTSTTGFPGAGKIVLGGQVLTYTGTTSNTFTGVTGGTGTFGSGSPVTFGTIRTNDVLLMEHTYCSINSRNDPTTNLTNYVDVYVSGQDGTSASESVIFPTSSNNFVSSPSTSAYYTGKFARISGAAPTVGNRLMEMLWQPIISLPTQIVINGTTYYQGTDYWQITDITNYRGSRRSRDGIEWSATAATSIGVGTEFVVDYTFDRLPIALNELMDGHKQITTDVLVHSAVERFLNINLIVMYASGFSKASVDTAIDIALTDYLEHQYFGAVVQLSDIVEIAHNVPGVDNVRIATSTDGISYGIQEVAVNGTTPIGLPHTTDFFLQDSDLPVLNRVIVTQRSQNTW